MPVDRKLIESYFDRLWPICRSLTGDGVRESLKILSEIVPLQMHEVPSGTNVFDWTVPDEWNISEAYIITPDGKKICDFKQNNLHVVSYSEPVDRKMSFEELDKHLHSLPGQPDAVPYLTSYYKRTWGFCISHRDREALPREGQYTVCISSSLKKGSLTYADCILKGETEREIFISTYVCHPSMANNELSGPLVAAFLYRELAALPKRRFTYRFVFIPETIGAIAYLAKFGEAMRPNIEAGYVVTCIGDNGAFTYKRSKDATRNVDRIAEHVLRYSEEAYSVIDFAIGGSDERQYCSPGFNFPVGSLMRTMYQRFPEYHTSLDNKSFISFDAMAGSVEMYLQICRTHELNRKYLGTVLHGEPQLGKRNLYPQTGGQKTRAEQLSMMLHLLTWVDGTKDLVEIAERFGKNALSFEPVIQQLNEAGLLKQEPA